jgi:hypothetical protein
MDFEMLPDMGDPLEQFATLATLKVPGFVVNTEVFRQSILGDEALVAVQAFMGSITYRNKYQFERTLQILHILHSEYFKQKKKMHTNMYISNNFFFSLKRGIHCGIV